MPAIRLLSRDWVVRPAASARARRAAVAPPPGLPPEFLTPESTVADEFTAERSAVARRSAAAPSSLDFT